MDATQLLDSSLDESETHYFGAEDEHENKNGSKKVIGALVFDESGKEFDINQGDTISIGRDPENCQIVQENKVSKQI